MYMPSLLNPSNMQRFVGNGIKTVSTTIQFPDAGIRQIGVFTGHLIVSVCHALCVILSDFNEDCLHWQNSAVVSLMSSFNF